jgi:uncharacterized protein (TIGR04255 family)
VPDDSAVTLPLPDPDHRQLEQSPLDVVVCQLQYEHNLAVADAKTARAIHDALGGRHGGFPRVEQVQTQTVSVGIGPAPAVSTSPTAGWRFSNEDRTLVVTVVPEHVSVETARYTNWDAFESRLGAVLAAVAEHVDPAFENRLGLRYIDLLKGHGADAPQDWSKIVDGHLLGPILHPGFGIAIRAAQQQLVLELDAQGTLCAFRHGLIPSPEEAPAYVLDYDFYREGSRGFDVEDALAAAVRFNTFALQLFQASITREHWESLA